MTPTVNCQKAANCWLYVDLPNCSNVVNCHCLVWSGCPLLTTCKCIGQIELPRVHDGKCQVSPIDFFVIARIGRQLCCKVVHCYALVCSLVCLSRGKLLKRWTPRQRAANWLRPSFCLTIGTRFNGSRQNKQNSADDTNKKMVFCQTKAGGRHSSRQINSKGRSWCF